MVTTCHYVCIYTNTGHLVMIDLLSYLEFVIFTFDYVDHNKCNSAILCLNQNNTNNNKQKSKLFKLDFIYHK